MEILNAPVYATQPLPLKKQLGTLLDESKQTAVDEDVLGIIVPDTNLLCGGPIAANVYNAIAGKSYDTVIMVSSSHVGSFHKMTICNLRAYHTPLGDIPLNRQLCHELCDEDDDIFMDDEGHYHNKGIDVQLPYLQSVLDNFDIVPIVMGTETPEYCRELGNAIGEIMFNRKALVVASVDILRASQEGLASFQSLFEANNVKELISMMNSNELSVLGYGPLLVAMIASFHRHGKRFQALDLTAPKNECPGYFGAYISK